MHLIPGAGVGEIRFGMTPREVGAIFGPETKWELWMGGNLSDWLFCPGIIFFFDKHDIHGPLADGKLVQIEAHSSFPGTLFGTALSLSSRADVLLHLHWLGAEPKECPNGAIETPTMHVHWWFRPDGSLELMRFDDGNAADLDVPSINRPLQIMDRIRRLLGMPHRAQ